MRVLFVSSVNLTTNPRIFKELQLAYKLNHQITFVGFKLGNWTDAGDEIIRKEFPSIKFIYLDATRKKYFEWLYFSLFHVFSKAIWWLNKNSLQLSAMAHSKRTIPLLKLFKKLRSNKYDLIVAHTLAALYPSSCFAKNIKCDFAFDVEDYHPGEKIDTDIVNEKKRREILLKKILPQTRYVTSASYLIGKNVEGLVVGVKTKTVLNYFQKNEFIELCLNKSTKIKLVWFSQNRNAGRGLELVLAIWEDAKNYFELTLIGKLDTYFYENCIKQHPDIIIKGPMEQKDLHKDLASYDIGLAIDVDHDDFNRQLAITNKILAYFQSGLYILATNTPAQRQLID